MIVDPEICRKCGRETTMSSEGFGPYCDGCGLPVERCPCLGREIQELRLAGPTTYNVYAE